MSEDNSAKDTFVWYPNPDRINRSNMMRFIQHHDLKDFGTLLHRSTTDIAWFTAAILDFLDIRFSHPYSAILDTGAGAALAKWCVGGRMNIVSNCLDKHLGTSTASSPALIYESEAGEVQTFSYAVLSHHVNQAASGLRSLGIQKGDVVALYTPMTPEIVIALLAVARIGAVILPLFSGFGAGALITRMVDTGAKVLITQDGAYRRGKLVPMKSVADEAANQSPKLQHIIVVRKTKMDIPFTPGRDIDWNTLMQPHTSDASAEDTFAEDPLMVIYTSGTTGQPKGAVHTHCSFPVKAAQDMSLCMDVKAGERVYWVTDMGWMMGPWLVFGTLLLGATMVISDGAPDYPTPDRLWQLVAKHRINLLGISPSLIRALMAQGDEPVRRYDLSSLNALASTGEPWNLKPWRWLFEVVGRSNLPIYNYSGGTEISGGILCGNPLLPMKPMAFSAPCPGMAAAVFDETGQPVLNRVGELVITAPWIGMTRGFWNDPQRYLDTYWSRWSGVWQHGDWAEVDSDGQWYIFGRSDDTIKIAGKRLGPAEVETEVVANWQILEAAAIGIPDEMKGESLVVFCVLRPGLTQSGKLKDEIITQITHSFGKAFTPKDVLFIPDLPKTRNAKVMRRMIRAAYLGLEPGDISALVNPEALNAISGLRSQP